LKNLRSHLEPLKIANDVDPDILLQQKSSIVNPKGLVMNKGYILLLARRPQPKGARRRAGICFVAAPRR
jgi:hypothetical protein